MQFVYGTFDVNGFSCFYLIYPSFCGFIRLNATGSKNKYIVHLGNTMGDCCGEESGISLFKTNNLNGKNAADT